MSVGSDAVGTVNERGPWQKTEWCSKQMVVVVGNCKGNCRICQAGKGVGTKEN